MVALPINDHIVMPAVLKGRSNGKLPSSILVTWTPPWGGPVVTLVEPAMRAYRAMLAHAATDGIRFKSVGSYRSHIGQVNLFTSRYRRVSYWTPLYWDGSYWVHVSGAVAALPGTSNHGWGITDDLGEERDGDGGVEPISPAAVGWLVEHAHEYGFSAELQSEAWHWRYVAGRHIPRAVLSYEEREAPTMIGLRKGDTGHAVRELQVQLKIAGHYKGEIDGTYAASTAAAVLALRKASGSGATSGDSVDVFGYEQIFRAAARAAAGQPTPGPGGIVVGTRVAIVGEITGVTPAA